MIINADKEETVTLELEGHDRSFGYGYTLLIIKKQASDQPPTQETVSQSSAKEIMNGFSRRNSTAAGDILYLGTMLGTL